MPSLRLLERNPGTTGATDRSVDEERSSRDQRAIRCAACNTELSEEQHIFSPAEGPAAAPYLNPHGVIHEVITVHAARNLVPVSEPTTEFSWFPPWAWEITVCAGCEAHIGWRFTGSDEPRVFWGLRTDSITLGPG